MWRGAPTAGSEGVRYSAIACAASMRASWQPGTGGPRRQASYGSNGCTGAAYLVRSISKCLAAATALPGCDGSLPALECVADVTAVLALLVMACACARASTRASRRRRKLPWPPPTLTARAARCRSAPRTLPAGGLPAGSLPANTGSRRARARLPRGEEGRGGRGRARPVGAARADAAVGRVPAGLRVHQDTRDLRSHRSPGSERGAARGGLPQREAGRLAHAVASAAADAAEAPTLVSDFLQHPCVLLAGPGCPRPGEALAAVHSAVMRRCGTGQSLRAASELHTKL